MKIKSYIFSFLCCTISFAQVKTINPNAQKIINLLDTYFNLDREYIHVQFNKQKYVSNEIIGFKGYVYSKNKEAANTNTTNVNLVIYDSNNEIVKKQLIYASNGTFSNTIQLNDSFKSGLYHFQFYTNWMNNFNEDYSFSQTIEIINRNEPYVMKSIVPFWKTAKSAFYPESGVIINNRNNIIGVKITDCNQKGIQVDDVIVWGSVSGEVARFNTNKVGNGSFTFFADKSESYTLKIDNDKIKLSQNLPAIADTGIAIGYNNNLPKDKIAIVVKTNEKGNNLYSNKKFTLVVHQNEKSVLTEFSFANNETEHIVYFDKKTIANGVNSIRLIDENLNQVAERLFYNYATEKPKNSIQATKTVKDSIMLSGTSELKKANISISVLPEKSICKFQDASILGSFYLNNYLKKPEENNYFYFDAQNISRKLDMDVLLLNQSQEKSSWNDIKTKIPKVVYAFNKGVTISGKVETDFNLKTKNKLTLISTKNDVFEDAVINESGNFKFENFYAQDSTVFALQVSKPNGIAKYSRIETRVEQNEKDFVFPLVLEKNDCPSVLESKIDEKFTFKKNTIELATVSVVLDTKKKTLVNQERVGQYANAFKIEEDFGTVFDFLNVHGYSTGIDNETGNPFVTDRSGMNKGVTPSFRIDGNRIQDLVELYSISLADVDEIYIDKYNPTVSGSSRSVIDIFMKQGIVRKGGFKIKHNLFMVTKGFANGPKFKNNYFETSKEFSLFGSLNWTPTILLDDNPNFEVKFSNEGQKEIQVQIEGISEDGQIISDIQKISVN
jgi:hypothetical protein